jgi:peptidoglycan/xylan/chitin deacetylase (PgdA/CDA1 family)
MGAQSFLKAVLPTIVHRSGAAQALALRYRGRGTIFMLHSVVDDAGPHPDHSLRCPVATLARTLRWLRERGVEFVSLDEAVARLQTPASRPFAAFTFDDGYADTLTHALPVMARFGAPFTVYVTTGMITREIDAWWLGLAALIGIRDRLELPDLGRFDCSDRAAKKRAFVTVETLIHRDFGKLAQVQAAIEASDIDCRSLVNREALTAETLRQLARHPLVTIGAHATTHGNLARASAEAVRREMGANRAFLEDIIQQPVVHFAYPFGHAGACTQREADIARSVGFRTAVTTRRGTIFPAHLAHLHALPREPLSADDTASSLRCKVDGVYRAFHSRLGDPVAHM